MKATARLVASATCSSVAAAALVAAGRRGLAAPPARSWTALERWYDAMGAGAATVALARVAALAGVVWLLGASLLQLVARARPGESLHAIADAMTPPVLRRWAHGVAGLSVMVGLSGPPAPPGTTQDPAGTAVMELIDPPAASPTTTAPSPPPVAPAPAAPAPDEVRVAPGDSFWTLAEEAVADHGQGGSVDAYWRRLIEANRHRLVDPATPDLLYPGQVLVLPPVDA